MPERYLKTIQFGALKGKSDINPQWRVKAMTEVYGMCGIGWAHREAERWTTACDNGEVLAFCKVEVKIVNGDKWSEPIVGIGGNKIVSIANGKPKPNDEGWKMAYTDALGTALKSIGVASEIYEGNFDGSKYLNPPTSATPEPLPTITEDEVVKAINWGFEKDKTGKETLDIFVTKKTIPGDVAKRIVDSVDSLHEQKVQEMKQSHIENEAIMESMNG